MKGSRQWAILLVTLLVTSECLGRYLCPGNIAPCSCTVKQTLVVTCANTNMEKIQHSMTAFKEQPGTEISYLTLKTNNMPKLPDFLFMGMDIRHLFITNTNLAILDASSLTALAGKLDILDLPQNRISAVPSRALSRLHKTRILNIPHNSITVVSEKAFEGMSQLQRLSLYGNAITSIHRNAFDGVEKELIFLNLGGNRLSQVPTQAISKLQNLITLELEKNRIESIKESDFNGLSNLDTLKLGQNMISELGPTVFKSLPRMSSLDLESNRIARIDDRAFSGLEERLEWLKLGNNSVHQIPSSALAPMHRLREFDMKSNNITEINDNSFRGFGNTLKYLSLENNRIDMIPLSVFSEMHSLEAIKLSGNKIKHLPPQAFQSITETKAVIDVHDNPLVCDCDLQWYKQWLLRAEGSVSNYVSEARPLILKTKCFSERDKHEYMVKQAPLQIYCPRESSTSDGSQVKDTSAYIAIIFSAWSTHRYILV